MLPRWSTTAGDLMLPERRMFEDEACPVPDKVLGEMYRANPHGLNELIVSVPPAVRGMLAMYCYRRAHLASIALAIAATCDEDDLTRHGGNAGCAAVCEIARGRIRAAPRRASGRAPQDHAGERHAAQLMPVDDEQEDVDAARRIASASGCSWPGQPAATGIYHPC